MQIEAEIKNLNMKKFLPLINSLGTVGKIVSDVWDTLIEWEPRIDILDVDTTQEPQKPKET